MYKVGDEVSYGLHGKCVITGIETKDLPSGPVSFYQIRTLKNPITAKNPNRKDACILIPVETAQTKGLRPLMSKDEALAILNLLAEPDYHFSVGDTWINKQKMLEEVIRKEGAVGLAKVVGHLHVVIKRDAVPRTEVMHFYDNAFRVLVRELTESLATETKEAERLVQRALKTKLAHDH